jgi:deazaflavin-dependent oxidoreductase (nitroreductase family)
MADGGRTRGSPEQVGNDGRRRALTQIRSGRHLPGVRDDGRLTLRSVGSEVHVVVTSPEAAFSGLGYGPRVEHLLEPLHRGFLFVNRWCTVPAIKAGLGPLLATPLTGSMMILRTTGRRSGQTREAPLGYAIRDGAVWCVAGFGRSTHWYQNVVADPHVEVVLPGAAFSGEAEEVTDQATWVTGFRLVIDSLGIVGRMTVPGAHEASDAELIGRWGSIPVVRIRPTGIGHGPSDPGGSAWLPVLVAEIALVAGAVHWLRHHR